jgi:hypothetical protein
MLLTYMSCTLISYGESTARQDSRRDLAGSAPLSEAERVRWGQLRSKGASNMKMTEQQKADYKLYRKACRFAGVWPTRVDFLTGDIPSCVRREMGWEQQTLQPNSRDA